MLVRLNTTHPLLEGEIVECSPPIGGFIKYYVGNEAYVGRIRILPADMPVGQVEAWLAAPDEVYVLHEPNCPDREAWGLGDIPIL